MITLLAYGMIAVFLVLLTKKKLNVFTALILVPIVFGIAACLLLDKDFILIFDWVKKGLFFSQNATTHKVKMGVMSGDWLAWGKPHLPKLSVRFQPSCI